MKKTTQRLGRAGGFTLVEVIVVLGLAGIFLVGMTQLMLDTARTSFITSEKFDITADVRQFTLEMAENARAANHFFVYRSFGATDRNDPDKRLRDGEAGDFLLLIFQQPWPNLNSPEHTTRLVGYFRLADPANPQAEGPVYRFEKNYYPPSATPAPTGLSGPYVESATVTVESLIQDLQPDALYPTVVQLSRGLANGKLFYNYLDRSVMVKAEIIHGNAAKRITDTYNYTVSPRG